MNYDEILKLAVTLVQPAVLLSAASALVSLIVSYIPGWREKWAAKDPTFKAWAMLLAVTIIAALAGVASFTGFLVIVPATKEGLIILVFAWISSLWTNQATYQLSVPTASVRAVKANKS